MFPDANLHWNIVEDFPLGYPRYSALVASDTAFYICRRFSKTRARLLLLKQDKIAVLEERLTQIDDQEQSPLFLGMSRADSNPKRREILDELDIALRDYDDYVERICRILKLTSPSRRDITSLSNWLNGTAALARDETRYLQNSTDLASLDPGDDSLISTVHGLVEDALIRFFKRFRKLSGHTRSRDAHVYLYSGALITRLSRLAISSLMGLLLVIPIAACYATQSVAIRLFIIFFANVALLTAMASFSYRRTFELFLAGATYSAVLVVVLSSSSSGSTSQ
ncbi:hypothetical protein BDW02DRAFT_593168 [Decorospora gaudefroyi]|uniref:DUF6594 domain-containing protein n=1 Tax=Decorospora gaudefroyi TaxID=184978 RepID=A0A6A5JX87_9PLEO|nr:hypothetical protein BDW02DRAFT_593168 [Decorospora gaudefroyi]